MGAHGGGGVQAPASHIPHSARPVRVEPRSRIAPLCERVRLRGESDCERHGVCLHVWAGRRPQGKPVQRGVHEEIPQEQDPEEGRKIVAALILFHFHPRRHLRCVFFLHSPVTGAPSPTKPFTPVLRPCWRVISVFLRVGIVSRGFFFFLLPFLENADLQSAASLFLGLQRGANPHPAGLFAVIMVAIATTLVVNHVRRRSEYTKLDFDEDELLDENTPLLKNTLARVTEPTMLQ